MRYCFLLTTFVVFVWANTALAADSGPEDELILGPAETDSAQPTINPKVDPPLELEAPPKPGVLDAPEDKKTGPATQKPASPQDARATGTSLILEAQRLLLDRRYDDAVAASSEAIELDPSNAPAYKNVRANAYLLSGRFEQALADRTPLTVVVGSRKAELKSGLDVVGEVRRRTKLSIDKSEGDWLKVASIDGSPLKWAWIHKRDVAVGKPRRRSVLISPEPLQPQLEFRRYRLRPWHDYGRTFYDYSWHVPPRYRKYLP